MTIVNSKPKTDADIATLTKEVLTAADEIETGRSTYLRWLVADTQTELGAEPPKIRRKPKVLEANEIEGQLAALNKVHERFYAVVTKTASEALAPAMKDRAQELNRRTNFARSSVSTVRTWIKAGNDVTTLAPARVTKSQLAAPAKTPKPPSTKRLKSRAATQSKELVKTLLLLSESDKDAAASELQLVIGQLVDEMVRLGVAATKDAAKAITEHRPLSIKGSETLFMPTSSAVVRQMARPS